jgi:5-methylcytosine-specific restriction endonuclease McrA
MSRTITTKDLDWWQSKIIRGAKNHRTGGLRGFGPIGARHAVHLLVQLVNTSPSYRLSAPTLPEFATLVGLNSKFVPRAVAMLARSGLVRAELVPSPSIVLLPDRFARRKNSAQSTPRRRLSRTDREQVFHSDRFKCGHCRRTFPSRRLDVGHIVPVSLLGADRPANWITLCREHNGAAWDAFDPMFLRLYRGRRVLRPTGVRFRGGFFWPVVNGQVRLDPARSRSRLPL